MRLIHTIAAVVTIGGGGRLGPCRGYRHPCDVVGGDAGGRHALVGQDHPGLRGETSRGEDRDQFSSRSTSISTTLAAMTAGNSLPDLFYGHVKAAELGRAGLAVNYKDAVDEAFLKQFYPGLLRQFHRRRAQIYALPGPRRSSACSSMTGSCKELGLTPPNTWDELIAMAPKIREAGLTPVAFGNLARNVRPDFLLPLIAQYGGDVYALDDLTKPGLSWIRSRSSTPSLCCRTSPRPGSSSRA